MAGNKKVKIVPDQGGTLWNFKADRLAADLTGSDFISSESILMLASPDSTYGENALQTATAVALAQNIDFNQQRQASQIFEIGSRRKYTFSSGRIQGTLGMGRILFDGPSLLRSLKPDLTEGNVGGENQWEASTDAEVGDHAGYGNFYINLGATLFSKPIGLFLVMKDVEGQNVGGIFLEGAYIVTHAMSINANQPFIGENVSILFEGVYPLEHRAGLDIATEPING